MATSIHSERGNHTFTASLSFRHTIIHNWLGLCLSLLCLLSTTSAYIMEAQDVSNTTYYRNLARQGQLVIDTRIPAPSQVERLIRRQDEANSTITVSTSSASRTPTSTASSTSTEVLPTSTTLPSPFDTSLGNNFTTTACPAYFQTFLNNATFQACLPVSLLLQNSMSFFKVARSQTLLDQTLDASCQASLAICSPLMKHIADQLISNSVCGDDYERQNPLVLQAYSGLIAYEPMYKATCLKDQTTSQYCFAQALTNSTNPSDSYPYYTAIGIDLPTAATPSCSECLHNTMQIFAGYAVQKAQPLSSTYLNCALQINQGCGNSFADVEVKAGSSGVTTNSGGKIDFSKSTLLISGAALVLWQLFI